MENMMNWFTRKKVLVISLVAVIIQFTSRFSVDFGICSNYSSQCGDYSYLLVIFTYIFIATFIFSLITFKLNGPSFIFWRNFSILWVSFSLIIITFLPTLTHGLDFFPITKGSAMFFLTILYSVISLILILYKSLKKDAQ